MSAKTILATYKEEDVNDYSTEDYKGYLFISTAGHGYLCVRSVDNGYSDALRIARNSNYSYILDGGLVFLEEDNDLAEFLVLGMDNTSIKATDFMESMGIHVVRIK